MSDHASSSTTTEMAQNSVFERFARAGYVVSGLLHLTIGYLAIRIAVGSGGGNADQSGAATCAAGRKRRLDGVRLAPCWEELDRWSRGWRKRPVR